MLFRGGITDQDAIHLACRSVTAVVPTPVVADAGHDEEIRCHPLYMMPGGAFFFARNVAGESFSGFATDCTVKLDELDGGRCRVNHGPEKTSSLSVPG